MTTLQQVLETNEDLILNDGGTTWDTYNLLDALDDDSLAEEVAFDVEGGTIRGYDSEGYLGCVLYRVDVEQ